ncbi:MAG: hypothetical protein K2O48_07010 [Prevotella sp.]|nr:hypothetical protein [Prevotella sp.]
MKKLAQNKIAESTLTLPFVTLYAAGIWLARGLVQAEWWFQVACFAATAFLMAQLNTKHSLIRIYSRLVSCTFMVLMCCASFLLPSTDGAVTSLFLVLTYYLLFMGYQDNTKVGVAYYAFLSMGMASMGYVHVLYLVPLLWLFMRTHLAMLSWRTWGASILGLLTPYWFTGYWFAQQHELGSFFNHFRPLADFQLPLNFSAMTEGHLAVLALVAVLIVIGTIHTLRKGYHDGVRTRTFYAIFIWTNLAAFVLLALQPQHCDLLLRVIIINTAPLTAHFFALTSTKLTNVALFALLAGALLLTAYNL